MLNIFKRKDRRTNLQVINDEMDSLRQKKAELEGRIISLLWPLLFDTSSEEPKKVNITLCPPEPSQNIPCTVTALWIEDNGAIMADTDIQGEADFDTFFTLEEKVQILNKIKD